MPTQFYPMTHDDALALIAVLQAFAPGLVTTTQRGMLAPDAEAIENGFIKLATASNKGLMSAAFAALLADPDKIIFYDNSVTGNAGFHNSIYRGKYLGDHFTEEQSQEILAGTFGGMFVGDYWTINGVDWVIVGFDIRYNIGDTPLTTHHIGVMPRESLNNAQWYTSNDSSHGYVGSTVRSNIKGTGGAQEKFIAAFGSGHVLSFRELYPTTYSSGNATGWAWTDARTELLSEVDVYGCMAWSLGGKGYEVGADKSQLPIFRLRPDFANIRANWWLRSVYSAANACSVNTNGGASDASASGSIGVRPLSLIA